MRTRRPFVLVSSLLAAIAGGGGLFNGNLRSLGADQEPRERPHALIQVVRHAPRILSPTVEAPSDSTRDLQTQAALIKSRRVLQAALRDPKLRQAASIKSQTNPTTWLRRFVDVTNPKDTGILQIALAPGSGASDADQAAIVNAVKQAYFDEVVNADARLRAERHTMLKTIYDRYKENLGQRREVLHKLSWAVGRDEVLRIAQKEALPRLYRDLRAERMKLRLERAEAETLLARRKKGEGATTDRVRQEMARLEDRLAIVAAREKALDEELKRMTRELREDESDTVRNTLELKELQEEIGHMEAAARQIAAEMEKFQIEFAAPPRIRVIEDADASAP